MTRDHELLPGVHHIELSMDVCATLLVGRERALLLDTGFGIDDVRAAVSAITPLPVELILTHGHFDHALGARQFARCAMFADDMPDFLEYTRPEARSWVLDCARAAGVRPEIDAEAFLRGDFAPPEPLREGTIELGGLTARLYQIPGHTPGSAVAYVPEHRLLLTGDDWNECTWLFFERALPVKAYRESFRRMLELPFERAICPHRTGVFDRSVLERFYGALTDAALEAAPEVRIPPYERIHTCELTVDARQRLVFDRDKL